MCIKAVDWLNWGVEEMHGPFQSSDWAMYLGIYVSVVYMVLQVSTNPFLHVPADRMSPPPLDRCRCRCRWDPRIIMGCNRYHSSSSYQSHFSFPF